MRRQRMQRTFSGETNSDRFHGIEKPEEWNLVNSLSYLLQLSEDSGLTKAFWKDCREALDYASPILGLNDVQTLIISLLVDEGDSMSWRKMGEYFGCTRLQMMTWSDDIEDLVKKGWVARYASRECGKLYEGFRTVHGVATALRHNQPFVPEDLSGLNIQEFVDRLASRIERNLENPNIRLDDDIEWMNRLMEANPDLELCKEINTFSDKYEKALFLLVIADYAVWADSPHEGLRFDTIHSVFPEDHEAGSIRAMLRDGTHRLLRQKYIEYGCDEGIADSERFMLNQRVKETLLSEYKPSRIRCGNPKTTDRLLQSHTAIKEKELYYNENEQRQIRRLTSLLTPENFEGVRRRLDEQGMRKGFACIFYGAPGTGKTETVLQLARETGRDVMKVELAGLRDKWVGQSERNIKGIFMRYRELCKNRELQPILFFNEADAIFNKRLEEAEHSVDKMNNAMQNIILQELEDLDGILIATTNLSGSLDSAFERRFLFKVEFQKPSFEAKSKIWISMMKGAITNEDAHWLAKKYDFSGGEIENIIRKQTINYVLEGETPTIESLALLCEEELIKLRYRKTVGF